MARGKTEGSGLAEESIGTGENNGEGDNITQVESSTTTAGSPPIEPSGMDTQEDEIDDTTFATTPPEFLTMIQSIDEVINAHEADVFLYSGDMTRSGADEFLAVAQHSRRRKNCFLILSTYGGDADAAFIIARYLKRTYKKFILCVFGYCKSAGTLLALGADEIVMSPNGEFGPLDVQLVKPDEIGLRSSGLDLAQALNSLSTQAFSIFERQFLNLKRRSSHSITTRTAGEIASSLTIGLLAPITSQIDPLKMGEMQRATQIAFQYGYRLCNNYGRVTQLIQAYSSHSFVIDIEEATEVFESVREPNDAEKMMVSAVSSLMSEKAGGIDCVSTPYDDGVVVVCIPSISDTLTSTDEGSDEVEAINEHETGE